MKLFKVVYQDKALKRHINYWEAECWADAVVMAFSRKPAEMKLIYIECHSDKVEPEFFTEDFRKDLQGKISSSTYESIFKEADNGIKRKGNEDT